MNNKPETVILGEESKPLKPIQIIKKFDPRQDKFIVDNSIPDTPQRIELIKGSSHSTEYDIIFIQYLHKTRSAGDLYLGHWNDGVYNNEK